MSSKQISKKTTENQQPFYRKIFIYIFTCAVFFIFFAARLHIDTLSGDSLKIFANTEGMHADMFLYCKEILLFITALAACAYAGGERIFPDRIYRKNPLYTKSALFPLCCIGVYFLLTLISSLFSAHREVTFLGICDEYEGVAAIFSYCILFMAGYNFFTEEKNISFYKKAAFVLTAVTGLLAVFEYAVMPLMNIPFMKYLVFPAEYRAAAEEISKANTFRESALMFFNSNYLGGFCTIIVPISLSFVISARSLSQKICSSVVCGLAYAAVIASNSTAALYTVIAETAVIILFLIIRKKLPVKNIAVLIVSAAVITGAAGAATDGDFFKTLSKGFTNAGTYSADEKIFVPEKINISGYNIIFSGNGSEYSITVPVEGGQNIEIQGLNSTKYTELTCTTHNAVFKDDNTGVTIGAFIDSGVVFLDLGFENTIDFAITTDGLKAVTQNAQLIDEIPENKFNSSELSKYYSIATGRGFVWLNTIPVLKKCILTGKGSGNFPFNFTQWDIAGLLRTHGTHHLLMDKPHSWYLQIAVCSGIPALITVLILFGTFAVSGGITFIKSKNTDPFMLCMYTGLCGFMVIGLVNDSMVTVNPFFWLNLGIAFCYIRSRKVSISNE